MNNLVQWLLPQETPFTYGSKRDHSADPGFNGSHDHRVKGCFVLVCAFQSAFLVFIFFLHCALSFAAQCIVIGPVCGLVCVCVCVCVCVFVGLLPR